MIRKELSGANDATKAPIQRIKCNTLGYGKMLDAGRGKEKVGAYF
jgi:hypothetical protein